MVRLTRKKIIMSRFVFLMFLGEIDKPMFLGADLPSGRPAGAAEVKGGAAGTRSHAQASQHGENPPFDRSEHDGTVQRNADS